MEKVYRSYTRRVEITLVTMAKLLGGFFLFFLLISEWKLVEVKSNVIFMRRNKEDIILSNLMLNKGYLAFRKHEIHFVVLQLVYIYIFVLFCKFN